MTTVISETVAPRPTKKRNRYFLVSSLRRAMKLMSCTSTRFPAGAPSASSGLTETSSGPSARCSRCPDEPENLSRLLQRIADGRVGGVTDVEDRGYMAVGLSLLKISYCTFHPSFTFFQATTYFPTSSTR